METFIELVKRYPCLWDVNHMSYRDGAKKDLAWRRIARECGMVNGIEAKSQWKKLRDSHREALRRRKGTSGQPVQNNRPWKYEAIMKFVLQHGETRAPIFTNIQSDNLDTDAYNDTDLSIEPENVTLEPYRRNIDTGNLCEVVMERDERLGHRSDREDRIDVPQDALKSLFDSFYQKTRELPRYLQLRVQREAFEAITKAEEEAMTSDPTYFSPASSSSTYEYKTVPIYNEYSTNNTNSPDTSRPTQPSPTYGSPNPEVPTENQSS